MLRVWKSLSRVFSYVVTMLICCVGIYTTSYNVPAHASAPTYTVTRVIDGDTIVLDTGRQVRLLGINTMEVAESGKPVECWGDQATYYMQQILEGSEIYLEYSSIGSILDQYNRILAYVYRTQDDLDINHHLLEQGYAESLSTYNHDRFAEFTSVEQNTRAQKRGYWGAQCQGRRTLPNPPSANDDATQRVSTPASRFGRFTRMPMVNIVREYYDPTST